MGVLCMARQEDDWPTIAAGAHEAQQALRLSAGQIFGPYRIVRLLGHGGMGEVYEAEHLEHGRRIALKILKHSLTRPHDRERFLREGRLAASITHPNCVYSYSTSNDSLSSDAEVSQREERREAETAASSQALEGQ